jgi:hypothetical protein
MEPQRHREHRGENYIVKNVCGIFVAIRAYHAYLHGFVFNCSSRDLIVQIEYHVLLPAYTAGSASKKHPEQKQLNDRERRYTTVV